MFIFTDQTVILHDDKEPIQATLAAHDSVKRDGNIGTVYRKERDCIYVVVYDSKSDTWIIG